MLLAGFVLAHLGIVQVECTDASNHEGLHVCLVTLLGDGVSLIGNVELGTLVVELLHQDEEILVKVHGLLSEPALHHLAVALSHLHLSATLAPIQQRHLEPYLYNLIVLQRIVRIAEPFSRTGKPHLGKQGYLTQVTLRLGYVVIGFQLASTDVVGKGIVGQCLVQSILIVYQHGRERIRQDRFQFYVFAQGQERAELEHVALERALVIGQGRLCIQHVQFQLQHIVLADLAHLAFGLCHFV